MAYVLGIDIGTGACKCSLLDNKGNLIKTRSKEFHPSTNIAGKVEQNPLDWYEAVIYCLKQFEELDNIDLNKIVSISSTGQMQGITLIGKDGDPVRPSILWNDTRAEECSALLNKRFENSFIENCTFPCTPALTVSKIAWLKKHEQESWNKTKKFTLASNFITYKLTGEITTDKNNINLTGLNDVRKNSWSDELIELCGVEREKIPKLIGCFEKVGIVTPQAARETGLREGTSVFAGGGDAGAEGYSIGLAGSKKMKVRLGTAADVGMVVNLDEFKQSKTLPGGRDVLSDYVLISNYTKACAASVKWIRDVFYSEHPKNDATYKIMDDEAKHVELGAGGLIYHPYLAGENAPYFNNELRAKFTGMNMGHRRQHFLRSGYEGISYSIRDLIESIPYFENAKQLIFVGGGTKSALWMSILVDILGKNGIIPSHCDASYGVALMAGQASGFFDSKQVIQNTIKDAKEISYSEKNHQEYNVIFKNYKKLAQK